MNTNPDRVLAIPGVSNARHLGGLPLASGQRSRLGGVIRSGSLDQLGPEGSDTLRALGVRVVVDLRERAELDASPDRDLSHAGIAHLWAPLYERDPTPRGVHLEHGHAGYIFMYQNYLEYGRKAVCGLVEAIAEHEGRVLFHCAVGRDRTGLVSAILLAAAGVTDEAIIADHALSETRETLAARGHTGPDVGHRLVAPLRAMTEVLDQVRHRWGSAEGHLRDAGASRSAVDALQGFARRTSDRRR